MEVHQQVTLGLMGEAVQTAFYFKSYWMPLVGFEWIGT